MKTLLIVDLQNDFLPGGSLEVPGSDGIIHVINAIQAKFDLVIASQDWHPSTHLSFARNHPGKKPFEKIMLNEREQTLWPDHCVQNSFGAEFSSDLDTSRIEAIFRKGTSPEIDSYSCFFDNGHRRSIGLNGFLRERGAHDIYFCGLAADICVYYSIMDAISERLNCYLLLDATCPLDRKSFDGLKITLQNAGVKLLSSSDI